jgi:hypothetical protein
MLSAPFQCDHCCFVNIQKREPVARNATDNMLLLLIRQVNLDIFWSRESSTVKNTLSEIMASARIRASLRMPMENIVKGPWPVEDAYGFATAITILRKSLDPGKNVASYQQFDSIRKLRSGMRNTFQNSLPGCATTQVFMDGKGKIQRLAQDPTHSWLFSKFMLGCEKRMGRFVKQNQAMDIKILLEMLRRYELELAESSLKKDRRRRIYMCGFAYVVLFCKALRGGEIMLTEATSLCSMLGKGRKTANHPDAHVVVPLMGRFKGETGERNVLCLLASVTKSGIDIRRWVERLVFILMEEGRNVGEPGPALCDKDGFVLTSAYFNEEMHDMLEKIQMERSDLIPADVKIRDIYKCYRTWRRGATIRANALQYSDTIINFNNRWRTMQNPGGTASLPMGQLYLDILTSLTTHLHFSRSL